MVVIIKYLGRFTVECTVGYNITITLSPLVRQDGIITMMETIRELDITIQHNIKHPENYNMHI